MSWKNQARAFVVMAIVVAAIGCTTVEKSPDVVTTPGTTTIVHDRTSPPNIVVTPPASTHTDTHTDTKTTLPPPDQGTAGTSTTTTTGTSGN